MRLRLNTWTKVVIWTTGIALSVAVEAKFFSDRKQAESNYRQECKQELHRSAADVAAQFHALYADLRTIARMPAIRSSRLTRTFLADDWADIRELYASMAESTPVRRVRLVPRASSWTSNTVDTLILSNKMTQGKGDEKLSSNSLPLRMIAGQMALMPQTNAHWDWNNLQRYPAYSCRPIKMKMSTDPKGPTYKEFVTYYSVPIYSLDGQLWGSASAELPFDTVTRLLSSTEYDLLNESDGIDVHAAAANVSPDDVAFTEEMRLAIEDRVGHWKLKFRPARGQLAKRPDMVSAQEFRWVAHVIVAGLTIAAFFVFSSLSRRRYELEEAKTSLEGRVSERTNELAEALREAKDASRIKGEFLANMSHEIRTPMNGVMAMTELLMQTRMDDEQQDLARTISSSADSLLTIINDVLDFSKIEAKKLVLEQTQFFLADLFEDVVKLHAPAAISKGLEILAELDPSVERMVIGDPVRIRQIASNLLGNAIKFTDVGSVILCAHITGEGLSRLKFSVKDTGVGIPANRIDAVFESFTQSDASTTRKFGGTGLGLTISRHLSELMGGRIGVHSKLGKGSEFFVNVLIKDADVPISMVAPVKVKSKRILVCDDFEPALGMFVQQLESVGHVVTKCSSAEEALEILGKKPKAAFDVLLIDHTLKGRDGIELCRQIRQEKLAERAVLLLATASPGGLAADKLQGSGIAQTLAKPIRKEILLRAVQSEIVENDLAEVIAAPSEPVAPPAEGSWLKVLLVEDNPVNQKVAKKLLANMGCAVTVANDGAEAILLDLNLFDVILMDCQMPRLDGLSATRQIRHREQRTGDHALIVALTANAMEEDRRNCLDAGMDDYLAKPLRQKALEDILKRLTQGVQAA